MTQVNKQNDYYGENAYHSDNIPHMPDQAYAYNTLGYKRLPWGNTVKEVIPFALNKSTDQRIKKEIDRLDRYGLAIPKEAL